MKICDYCNLEFELERGDYRYWPDHLWPGKIAAYYRCPKCKKWAFVWAHDLPTEFQSDIPRPDWEHYCLPRLLSSCEMHNIKAA